MLTSSQRARLRAIAQNLTPIFHVGKNGMNENFVRDVSTALDVHELIKIAVLKNSDLSAKDAMAELCSLTDAEPVGAIGGKFVIYRYSQKEGVEHLQF